MSLYDAGNNPAEPQLDQVQRWMQAVIMHPDGVVSGMQSDVAQSAIPLQSDQLDDVILPSRQLSSRLRLEVYANAYYARLLECLREEFSASHYLLGTETFDAFAFAYLQSYPSRSYTLADLGAQFPKFLEETQPAAVEDPIADNDFNWSRFLVELATLERNYSEVFSGPGVETRQLLQADEITALSPAQFWEARLAPVPCLRLLALHYPTHEYVSQFRDGRTPNVPDPNPTQLVITRRDYVVRRAAVDPQEFHLLQMLVDGQSVGSAIEQLQVTGGLSEDELSNSLHLWFRHWSISGYFLSLEPAC